MALRIRSSLYRVQCRSPIAPKMICTSFHCSRLWPLLFQLPSLFIPLCSIDPTVSLSGHSSSCDAEQLLECLKLQNGTPAFYTNNANTHLTGAHRYIPTISISLLCYPPLIVPRETRRQMLALWSHYTYIGAAR